MDNSYTILRRFTPPTCTLEIWGQNSPLSRWAKKTIVKNIRFKLSFDDPRHLDTEPFIITGDRDKLEQLYNAILGYTESFLERSFLIQSLTNSSTGTARSQEDKQPYLTSQGLVSHELNLGDLSSNRNHSIIPLSATQLFDLVSALEEYKEEMAVLTNLEAQETEKMRKLIPMGIGVAGILLAAGLTAVGIQVANRLNKEETAVAIKKEPQSRVTTIPPQEEVVPPEVPKVADKPVAKIEKKDPLSAIEKLPPPPAVDTPKPPPNIPDPAKYPPSGTLTIPPIPTLPTQETIAKKKPQIDNSQVESQIQVNSEAANVKPTPSETTNVEVNPQSTPNLAEVPLEKTEDSEIKISSENNIINPESTPTLRQNSQFPDGITEAELTEDKLSENSSVEGNLNVGDRIQGEALREQAELELRDRNLALNNEISKSTIEESMVGENEPKSAIPQSPQLEEVKSYFQQKWQSPSELKQTLEYRLILKSDGSIQRIIPIGKASEIYLDRTNIPLMGEPFVSPLPDNEPMTIRLLLSSDGEVRTFLE